MIGINPHIDEFFANCLEAKARIEGDDVLRERIKALEEIRIDGSLGEFRLKRKGRGLGFTGAVITADVFHPDIPSSPYVVIVSHDRIGMKVSSLVKYFGEIRELKLSGCPYRLKDEHDRIVEHLAEKEYFLTGDERLVPFGIDRKNKLIVHDLDAKPFYGMEDIITGAKRGKGKYAHLKEIWDVLTSDEYRL